MLTSKPEAIDEVSRSPKPASYESQGTLPYASLDDRIFECLLFLLFEADVKQGVYEEKFDNVTLMTGVADMGRDVKLLHRGRNVGLIQAKRYRTKVTDAIAGKEIIKFALHYVRDNSLMHDPASFEYFLAGSADFNTAAIALLDDFGRRIVIEPKLQKWVEAVIEDNEAFSGIAFADVKADLCDVLARLKIQKLNPTNIEQMLVRNSSLIPQFFRTRTTVDTDIAAKLVGQAVAEQFAKADLTYPTDPDIRRIRERLEKTTKVQRVNKGHLSLYGYRADMIRDLDDSGEFQQISSQSAVLIARMTELTMTWVSNRAVTAATTSLAKVDGLSDLGKMLAQTIVQNAAMERYIKSMRPAKLRNELLSTLR